MHPKQQGRLQPPVLEVPTHTPEFSSSVLLESFYLLCQIFYVLLDMSQLPLPREMVYLLALEESPQAEYRGVDYLEDLF